MGESGRVGCVNRGASPGPDEWSPIARKGEDRTRLIGRLTLLGFGFGGLSAGSRRLSRERRTRMIRCGHKGSGSGGGKIVQLPMAYAQSGIRRDWVHIQLSGHAAGNCVCPRFFIPPMLSPPLIACQGQISTLRLYPFGSGGIK